MPESQQIATVVINLGDQLSTIQLRDVDTGQFKTVVEFKDKLIRTMRWLPNGSGLLFLYQDRSSNFSRFQIGMVSYPDGRFQPVTKDTNNYATLTVSADGKTLATAQQRDQHSFYLFPAAGTGAKPPDPSLMQERGIDDFSWTSGGGLYLHEDLNVLRVAADGSNKTVLLNDAAVFGMNLCPDGKTLVLSWIGHGGNLGIHIWRMDANGSDPRQLSSGQELDFNPVCTPDSKQVYFSEIGVARIMRAPMDGSGKPEVVPGSQIPNAIVGDPAIGVSPDGKLLAFVSTGSMPDGSSTPQRLALVPLDEGPQPQVRFIEPNQHITAGPKFTPDGKAIVYAIRVSEVDNLWMQALDGSPGRQITNFPTEQMGAFHWSPDGKTLGMLRQHTESDVVLLREASTAP
jgi:Tol biopolymer transport system component